MNYLWFKHYDRVQGCYAWGPHNISENIYQPSAFKGGLSLKKCSVRFGGNKYSPASIPQHCQSAGSQHFGLLHHFTSHIHNIGFKHTCVFNSDNFTSTPFTLFYPSPLVSGTGAPASCWGCPLTSWGRWEHFFHRTLNTFLKYFNLCYIPLISTSK